MTIHHTVGERQGPSRERRFPFTRVAGVDGRFGCGGEGQGFGGEGGDAACVEGVQGTRMGSR